MTYSWSAPGITFDDPTSATPTATFPLGSTTVTLVVNDGFENSAPATVVVTVVDTIAPQVESVTASPDLLWPPNHQMVTVETTVVASDICDPIPIVTLVSATSSEPDDAQGGGDGNTTNDIQGADTGTSDFSIDLRSEREGKGTGRVYTLTYEATDHSGNTSATAAGTVDVPHDLGSVVEPIALAVSGRSATVVSWPAVTGAEHYDVIRGDLANIRVNGSDFDLGSVTCIANGITNTSTAGFEDNTTPAPGQTFFYAVQFFDGIADSSYGSESADKARTVQPSGGDCP